MSRVEFCVLVGAGIRRFAGLLLRWRLRCAAALPALAGLGAWSWAPGLVRAPRAFGGWGRAAGGDRREAFEDRAQLSVCAGSELAFDVLVDADDDLAGGAHQLLSAAGGVDALGAVVVGVGDAFEVAAVL